MKLLYGVFLIFAVLYEFDCQAYYVPLQVLVPKQNFSNFNNYTNCSKCPFNNGTSINSTQNGHLILGKIGGNDRLLFNEMYLKEGKWWASREKIIKYPQDMPAGYVRQEIISAIRVENQFYDGHKAIARLLAGGVGQRFAKIQLISPRGKGFKYQIRIYGR